jgi:hypothetical protein
MAIVIHTPQQTLPDKNKYNLDIELYENIKKLGGLFLNELFLDKLP